MSLQPGRALNRKEAQALAEHTIGPWAFVQFRWDCSQQEAVREYLICEMVAVADVRIHGCSNTSWRNAFHEAGIFFEDYLEEPSSREQNQ